MADDRSHQWLLGRGIDRPIHNIAQYTSQGWDYQPPHGDGHAGGRPQSFHSSSSAFQPDQSYQMRLPTFRFPELPSAEGSSFQVPIDLATIPTSFPAAQNQVLAPLVRNANQAERGKRNKYSAEEWKRHLPRIKQLYLEDDLTLEQTMARMTADHGFTPSEKVYKNKFKQLGWQKKLPVSTAQFIVSKNQERGAPTDFVLFDTPVSLEKAEETLRRSRNSGNVAIGTALMETPTGLKYYTPPGNTAKDPTPDLPNAIPPGLWTPLSGPKTPGPNYIPLLWRGNTRSDIEALSREAKEYEQLGNTEAAEKKYREALSGYERLVSPTHHDTMELGYQLAQFYAKRDRMLQADQVLDRMNRKIVQQWGLTDDNTIAHFLRIADMYNDWSRKEDAAMLMYRLIDASQNSVPDPHSHVLPSLQTMTAELPPARLLDLQTTTSKNVSIINYQLKVAKTQAKTNARNAMAILLGLIKLCEENLAELSTQLLHATCALIESADTMDDEGELEKALDAAMESCFKVLRHPVEKTDSMLEGAIAVADLHLENEREESAERILELVCSMAEGKFGCDGGKMISILIRIGKVYESNSTWDLAKPWFEQALSAAMTRFCKHQDLTRKLEKALEEKSFPHPVPLLQN